MPEEITKDTIILEDNQSQRTVLLERRHGYGVGYTIARFNADSCRLIRFEEDEKGESFSLNNEALEAFVAVYAQYKADMQQAAEAEQKRVESVIATAKQIVKENTGIHLETGGDNAWWKVSVPDAGFEYHCPAYTADDFLKQVQDALQALQNHQKELAKQQEALNKALELAKVIPGIKLDEYPHEHTFFKKTWHVKVVYGGNVIYQSKSRAFNGNDLYGHVKAAYRAYSDVADKPAEEPKPIEDAF